MRLRQSNDGRDHDELEITTDDHHPEPTSVTIEDTTTSLPPGTTFNLDLTLPHDDFQVARVQITGPKGIFPGNPWREFAEIVATRSTAEAMGHSIRDAGSKKCYASTYSKQNADAYLSHKIFDSNTGASNRYIAVQDASIIGSTLRITFRNFFGGSATLWVKGQALLW